MKNCYVITSMIEPDNSILLKEGQARTVLSTEDRLKDTIETILSIVKFDPTSTIFLLDGSVRKFEELTNRFDNLTYIHFETFNKEVADITRTHLSKSYGETMMLLEFLKHYKHEIVSKYDYLIKLSGRYYFLYDHTKYFAEENINKFIFKSPVFWDRSNLTYIPQYFLPSDMYVNDKLGGYYTVAYAVGKHKLEIYENLMFACAAMTDKNSKYFYVDIEYLLYRLLSNFNLLKDIVHTDWIIEGRGGQNGKYFRF